MKRNASVILHMPNSLMNANEYGKQFDLSAFIFVDIVLYLFGL